jgi:hypothetical protein
MKKRTANSERNSGDQRRLANLKNHQFKPGQSGNPKGRPRTRGLVAALKAAVAEVIPDGRTIEQALVDELISEALRGRRRLQAIAEIFDRLEGRPRQSLDLNDVTRKLQGRTDAELLAFATTGKWPEEKT